MVRRIKLSDYINTPENRKYMLEIGNEFLVLIEENQAWSFFEKGVNMNMIKEKYSYLKKK